MGEHLLGTAAHLPKKANTSFRILLIANSASISGLHFLHLFVWFGSIYKEAPDRFKTNACLIHTGACLNKTGRSMLKTDGNLFESRQASVLKRRAQLSKQVGAYFKQHVSSRLDLQTRIFKKLRNGSFRIRICQFKSSGRLLTTSGRLFKQLEPFLNG